MKRLLYSLFTTLFVFLISTYSFAFTISSPPAQITPSYAQYAADPDASDQGATDSTNVSVRNLVDEIGTSLNATIILKHTGAANTTTYTFSTTEVIPSNITLWIEAGALIADDASNADLTINGPIKHGLHQVFNWGNGSGTLSVGSLIPALYPEMFGAIDGTADEVQINAALDASGGVTPVLLQARGSTDPYEIAASIVMDTEGYTLKSIGGLSYIKTSADIDAITISDRWQLIENIYIEQTSTTTNAGLKFTDGGKYNHISNVRAESFYYGVELYSASDASGSGTAYNNFYGCNFSNAEKYGVYIYQAGDGWANENLFSGTILSPATTGQAVYCGATNNNKFIGCIMEGGNQYLFNVEDHGANVWIGNRFEGNGHGILINIDSYTDAIYNHPHISANFFLISDRVNVVVQDGYAQTDNYYNRSSGAIFVRQDGAAHLVTTVDADSPAAAKLLKITSTTGLRNGSPIVIDRGNANEEWQVVNSVDPTVSVTLYDNLIYTHYATGANTVESFSATYGAVNHENSVSESAFFVAGEKLLNIKKDAIEQYGSTGSIKTWVYQDDADADDSTHNLPDATSGIATVSNDDEGGVFLIESDGTVTLLVGTANCDATGNDTTTGIVNTAGTQTAFRNRLGDTGEIRIVYTYQ